MKKAPNPHPATDSPVEELHWQLMELNLKLREAESMKSHFISNIMNELVNPVASILGLSRQIQTLGTEQLHKAREMASWIHEEAWQLNFQLTNVFMAARLEAGEATNEIADTDVLNLVKSLEADFIPCFQKKQVPFRVTMHDSRKPELRQRFRTDPAKLSLIVSNLLDNSLKFSSSGEEVFLRILLEEGKISISVEDEGMGMDPNLIPLVFDRFKRLNPGIHSQNKGAGLGLSIVAALVDLLEGSISMTSEPGKGTSCTIILPEPPTTGISHASDLNEFLFSGDRF